MAYDGWFTFNETEIINLSRTTRLATALGIDSVVVRPSDLAHLDFLLETDLPGYTDVTMTPWYDPTFPASEEFAGVVPLSVTRLDGSTVESTPVEYITDGGHAGRARATTRAVVFSAALVASTERGAQYGQDWLNRTLRSRPINSACAGGDLSYYPYTDPDETPFPMLWPVYRLDAALTRGISVTRKRRSPCSSTWLITFTLSMDPYVYDTPLLVIDNIGPSVPTSGENVVFSGQTALVETSCPVYDYSPLQDPLFPSLAPAPTAPTFKPSAWLVDDGMTFSRFFAIIDGYPSKELPVVPMLILNSAEGARMVRVCIWGGDDDPESLCDPLASYMVMYLPPNLPLWVDGARQAIYGWDGGSPEVRRAESLVMTKDADPVKWDSFVSGASNGQFLVTLDVFDHAGSGSPGEGTGADITMSVALVHRTD